MDHDGEASDAPDFWKAHPAGKAILQGARRLRSLDLPTGGDEVYSVVNRATGPDLISWVGYATSVEHVSTNSPNLRVLCSTHDLRSAHIAGIAAGCHHLLSIQLSYEHITDDAVQTLLRHCPSIVELCLFDTEITVATIRALKSHRPLTLLTLGGQEERDVPLFDTEDTEITLGELLSARGSSLMRLRIGEARWRIGPQLATTFPDMVPSLRVFHLYGENDARLLACLAQRLPALRHPSADDSVEWEMLGTSLSPLVELYGTDDFDHLLAMDMCWDELAGTTPP
ncbi:hypothetical protein BDK51DRAFT_42481 [Blyttiomyces helicus]|uniref:F-box domain-containing protein n=1 Tax=Blyttiomyces helicus TaxID=388810 RepID=A0A4P9WKD4_9FUNG|nr:hypothetical protein BDK51DRAFT_42481 [Blyttiomyces helicus]|eukprot:RKO93274.1 hypothetical protein BDK51DRAFT_42481 [Blyttiomyces helicus]